MIDQGFNPLKPEQGYSLYTWNAGLSEPVICWMYAEAGSEGGPDEPPEAALVELHHAWLGNVDLLPILSEDQCSEIEDAFAEEQIDMTNEALIDAWESSREYDQYY